MKEIIGLSIESLQDLSVSSYNEGTEGQIDYYIDENKCNIGDKAYVYFHSGNEIFELEIIHIITRMDDANRYDHLLENDNILLDGEYEYDADTSAEFITDNNCYLVWFRYTCSQEDEAHESCKAELLS